VVQASCLRPARVLGAGRCAYMRVSEASACEAGPRRDGADADWTDGRQRWLVGSL